MRLLQMHDEVPNMMVSGATLAFGPSCGHHSFICPQSSKILVDDDALHLKPGSPIQLLGKQHRKVFVCRHAWKKDSIWDPHVLHGKLAQGETNMIGSWLVHTGIARASNGVIKELNERTG